MRRSAFTVVELLVAMLVSGILVGLTVSTFMLFQKNMSIDQNKADLSQNARLVLDRLSREIRQTAQIVTTLPASEIEYENGHTQDPTDPNYRLYFRYFISNGSLMLETKEYYVGSLPTSPSQRLEWDPNNDSLEAADVVPVQVVANDFSSFSVTQDTSGLIHLTVTTTDSLLQNYVLRTAVLMRN